MPFSFCEESRESLAVWLSKTPVEDRWDLQSDLKFITLLTSPLLEDFFKKCAHLSCFWNG